MIELFEKHEILHTKNLFIGKLNEALEFDIRINSIFPKLLNLPILTDNLIEGIVIKPIKELDQKIFSQRHILKVKNPEFEEDEDEVFHQAQKWSFIPEISSNTEELHFLVEEILLFKIDYKVQFLRLVV